MLTLPSKAGAGVSECSVVCNRTRLWGVSGEGSMAAHVETIGVDVGSSVLLRYCCFKDLSSGG